MSQTASETQTPSSTESASDSGSSSASSSNTISASASTTASSTRSATSTSSSSNTQTTSPSQTPSATNLNDGDFDRPTFLDEIAGDGTFGWDTAFDITNRKRGDVISEMRGRFGAAVTSASSFASKIFSSLQLTASPAIFVGAPAHQVFGSVESGDVMLGFLSESRSLIGYRTDVSSATVNSGVPFSFEDGDLFGSALATFSSTSDDILFVGVPHHGPAASVGAVGVFSLSATTSGIGVSELAKIGFDPANDEANYSELPTPAQGSVAQCFGTSLHLAELTGGGLPQLIVGAPGNKFVYEQTLPDGPAWDNSGSVWVVELAVDSLTRGAPKVARSFELTSAQVASLAGFEFASDAEFGHAVIVASGLMSTQTGVLLVGAPGHNNGAGGVFLVDVSYDTTKLTVHAVQELAPPADVTDGARFGTSIAEIPDANGDGAPDYVIGSPQRSPDGSSTGTGNIYLVSLNNSRSEICSAYQTLHRIDLHAAGFDCDNHATGPLPESLTLPNLRFGIKSASFLGNGTQPPPLEVPLTLDAGAAFGQSVGFIQQSTFPELVLVGVGAPFQGSAGSVYVFGFPKRSPDAPSVSPTPSALPQKAARSRSSNVAWIAGPVLGAFALPFLLYMRRKRRHLDAKHLALDHELYLASKFWPFHDFLSEEALGQAVGEYLEKPPLPVARELLVECLDLSVDSLRNVVRQELLTRPSEPVAPVLMQEMSGLCHRDLVPEDRLKALVWGMFGVAQDTESPAVLEEPESSEPSPPATLNSKSRSVEFLKPERPHTSKSREHLQTYVMIPE